MTQVFLHLLDMSLMAGWIVLAVLVLRLALHKAPRWCSCLLWGVVALRLVCPFMLESEISLTPPVTASQAVAAVEELLPPASVTDTAGQGDAAIPVDGTLVVTPPSDASAPTAPPAMTPSEPTLPNMPVPEVSVGDTPQAAAPSAPLSVNMPRAVSVPFVAAVVWLVGMGGMLAYILGSYVRLRYRLRTATVLEGAVYQSERVSSPFILGVVSPRIYLPYGMPSDEQTYVLAHERAHLRRGDHLIKLFASLLLAVYWFHPLLWVAYVVLCRDLELACDERVIRDYAVDQRRAYSAALLANSTIRRLPACPLAFGEVGVKQRIKSVMQYKKPAFWLVIVAVLAAVAVAACLLTSPRAKAPTAPVSGEPVAEKATFSALVLECQDKQLLVEPLAGSVEPFSMDKLWVILPSDNKTLFAPGDTVEIGCDNVVEETYPAQLTAVRFVRQSKAAPQTAYPLSMSVDLFPQLLRMTPQTTSTHPIYYYGFDEVNVAIDGKRIDLAQAIVEKKLDVTVWLEDLCAAYADVEAELYDDGGSAFYRFPHFSVLKLHQISSVDFADGSYDGYIDEALFIGIRDMEIDELQRLRAALNDEDVYTTATVTVTKLVSDSLVEATSTDAALAGLTFHLPLDTLQGDMPQVGDELEVAYGGKILKTQPATFANVRRVRVVNMSGELNIQYPLTVTKAPYVALKQLHCGTDYPVYSYGLDSVQVSVDGKLSDLVVAVKNRSLLLEDLLSDADESVIVRKNTYKDGGSVLYDFGYYRILKMHTIAGDNALIIGTSDMTITAVKALLSETTTTTTTSTAVPADLLQVTFDDSEKHFVSDAVIAAITPYEIYYTGVSSVRVKVDGKYVDLLTAIKNKQVVLGELLSDLTSLARQTSGVVIYGDGVDENGKPKTYQRRMFSTYSVHSYYSEDVKYVEFIAKKA